MKALQAAALQQQLMVAALTCHDVADYNRFVTSYRGELQKSDQALMDFFLRQEVHKGADGYNAYKTRLANASSLRSLRDPRFCRSAKVAFDVALKRKGSLAELASERPSLIETGYTSCVPGAPETAQVADATPNLPARHRILPDSLPSATIIVPKLAPRPDRVLPPISPQRYALALPKRSFGFAQAGKVPAPSGASETTQVADARPSLPARHQALPDSLPSALIIAPVSAPRPDRASSPVSPRRGNADSPRTASQMQARDSSERDTYNRDADTQDADDRDTDDRDTDERDNFDRDGTETRDDAGNDAPRYAPRYADAPRYVPRYANAPRYVPRYADMASARAYDRGDDGYGDDARDNSGGRDGYDNGPIENDAPGAYRYAYNVPRAYVPYAYRPHAYWVHSYGPPARPRLVRGPYGRWYLLPPYGR